MHRLKFLFWPIVISAICGLAPAIDAETVDKKSIDKISKEIASVTQSLNSGRMQLKSERTALQKMETSIVKARSEFEALQAKTKSHQALLENTKRQIEQTQKQSHEVREQLIILLQQQHKQGGDVYIKQLLNQENPYAIGRLNHYREILSKAMLAKLEEHRTVALALQQQQQLFNEELRELESDRAQLAHQAEKLELQRRQRSSTIAELDQKLDTQNSRLKQLTEDRTRLQTLLAKIETQAKLIAQNTPAPQRALVPGGFLKQKGRLQTPLNGKLITKYGQRNAMSGMRSNGLLYQAQEGTSVKAIFQGNVIFADYLKGFGLLMIIDHGDDHISLYGHNASLQKRVGDTVATGETIATVGTTGGLKSPSLYFEIRKNTQPIDPLVWIGG